MLENLKIVDGVNSKAKKLMLDGKQLKFEFKNEISVRCFSKYDRLKLSLMESDGILTESSKYFHFLKRLRDQLWSMGVNNLHDPISQEKFTKINVDFYRTKVFAESSNFSVTWRTIKDLFECYRYVNGKVKFSLFKFENKIFLVASSDTLIVGEEIEEINFI